MSDLVDRIRSEAAMASRAGQHDRLMTIAADVARMEVEALHPLIREVDEMLGPNGNYVLALAVRNVLRRHLKLSPLNEYGAHEARVSTDDCLPDRRAE